MTLVYNEGRWTNHSNILKQGMAPFLNGQYDFRDSRLCFDTLQIEIIRILYQNDHNHPDVRPLIYSQLSERAQCFQYDFN